MVSQLARAASPRGVVHEVVEGVSCVSAKGSAGTTQSSHHSTRGGSACPTPEAGDAGQTEQGWDNWLGGRGCVCGEHHEPAQPQRQHARQAAKLRWSRSRTLPEVENAWNEADRRALSPRSVPSCAGLVAQDSTSDARTTML